jgi:hypothetical protein
VRASVPLPPAYTAPSFEPPFRVLVLVASTAGWYAASGEERGRILDLLSGLLCAAENRGARLVGSMDDDLLATGQPSSLPYSIYILYDVDDLEVIVRLVHDLRSSELCRMLRMEARIGRQLFLLQN